MGARTHACLIKKCSSFIKNKVLYTCGQRRNKKLSKYRNVYLISKQIEGEDSKSDFPKMFLYFTFSLQD